MERVSGVLQKAKLAKRFSSDDEIARAVWPRAVGETIAAHTSHPRLVRTTLVVQVEDSIWQRQLHALARPILDRLNKLLGGCVVEQVEFRIGIPRRQPQRSESIAAVKLQDEEDGVQDPIFKKLYRISRKRAAS